MSIKPKTHADSKRTERDLAIEAFKLYCNDVSSPYSALALKLLNRNDYLGLASLDIKPSEYDNAHSFALDYSIYSYLRKYAGFPVDQSKLENDAILNLEKVEEKNRQTNILLKSGRHSRDVDRIIFYARRKIAQILGIFRFDKVLPHCEWGSGAVS